MPYTQKTIEGVFEECGVADPKNKTRLLSGVTEVLYDRNMHVVKLEAEQDPYKRKQIEAGIEELEAEIKRICQS